MDAEEVQLRAQLEQEKSEYKSALAALKELKHEIEHLQHLLETAKVGPVSKPATQQHHSSNFFFMTSPLRSASTVTLRHG